MLLDLKQTYHCSSLQKQHPWSGKRKSNLNGLRHTYD